MHVHVFSCLFDFVFTFHATYTPIQRKRGEKDADRYREMKRDAQR
jgi:hypothetical protein